MKLDRRTLAVSVCLALLVACANPTSEPETGHEDEHQRVEELSLSAAAYAASGISVAPITLRSITRTIQVTGTLSYDERHMAIATARPAPSRSSIGRRSTTSAN